MNRSRRIFIEQLTATLGALSIGRTLPSERFLFHSQRKGEPLPASTPLEPIDFRYTPSSWQSTYCLPDDPHKSLVGKSGELLYNHPGQGAEINDFPIRVSVGLNGQPVGDFVGQTLESPGIPIVSTLLRFGEIEVLLISFATSSKKEGRVDNLIIEFSSKSDITKLSPIMTIQVPPERGLMQSIEPPPMLPSRATGRVSLDWSDRPPLMVIDTAFAMNKSENVYTLQLGTFLNQWNGKLTFFARFPQENQDVFNLNPQKALTDARAYWEAWRSTGENVEWKLRDTYDDFRIACTRNIVQSREVKNGKKIFQVGPTVYRGLWVIDGNFLLEAARYLGYNDEAQQGLETIWELQQEDGGFLSGAGEGHWKDTPAALYATARQADLSQDWSYFKEMWPRALKAVRFLKTIRDKARNDGSSNGTYGLLPKGFGDSGIGGIRSELANSIWTVMGLKGFLAVADRLSMPDRDEVRVFYEDFSTSFMTAAREEMRIHPKGFSYLPMLMKDDPRWNDPDERKRPSPQAAQVYVSHAIYPGLLFSPDDPIVRGHVQLMQTVTKEEIPIESGWLAHDAVWPYSGCINAQVYLWLGLTELARRTFNGFLNHASPLFAWREEQTLRGIDPERYIGDMPHNWASAECIRFLRHMIIMEDGDRLRLFDGLVAQDFKTTQPISLIASPTKWGRVSVTLEPLDNKTWRAKFKRERFDEKLMPKLTQIEVPERLGTNLVIEKISGSPSTTKNGRVFIPPSSVEWEAVWRVA